MNILMNNQNNLSVNTKRFKCFGLLVLLATLTNFTISKAMQNRQDEISFEEMLLEDLKLLSEYPRAIHTLLYADTPEKVEAALKAGVDVNIKDRDGNSSLHFACNDGNFPVASRLIERGANVNAANDKGQTPLHLACKNGREEIVLMLMRLIGTRANVIDVNAKTFDEETPLYLACNNDHIEIVRLLLLNGADINQKTLEQVQTNLQWEEEESVISQQILAILNLTQRFDKCAKTGEWFKLTAQESLEDGLREFADRLLHSERKKIIINSEPKKGIAKTLGESRYRKFDDSTLICE